MQICPNCRLQASDTTPICPQCNHVFPVILLPVVPQVPGSPQLPASPQLPPPFVVVALDLPEHRLTKSLYIGLNTIAILSALGGILAVFAFITHTPSDGWAERLFRVSVTCEMLLASFSISLLLAAVAQALRYLATIASK